jgi:hypothetical protein
VNPQYAEFEARITGISLWHKDRRNGDTEAVQRAVGYSAIVDVVCFVMTFAE